MQKLAIYATPSTDIIEHWRQETPEAFRICPKIPRNISHAPRLDEKKSETLLFVERMRGLGTRLGPMFLQLPPSFAPTQLEQLRIFLNFWPTDVRLAVEVRHLAFFSTTPEAELNTLLSQYNIARVLMDTRPLRVGSTKEQQILQARERKPNLPLQMTCTTDFAFVRYIGHPRMEVNTPFLNGWAQQIGRWIQQDLTIYAFCHCPFEAHSPSICAELYKLVGEQVPLPPLPWQSEQVETSIQQNRLF